MARNINYLSGKEFILKLRAGERDFVDTGLKPGTDLTKIEGFQELNKRLKSYDFRDEPVNMLNGVYKGIIAKGLFLPYLNGYDIDFEGSDLEGVNFKYANMGEANFSHSNLSFAQIYFANLNCANLNCANLNCANLYHAKLKLVNANNADLRNADLRNSDFANSEIEGALFQGAKIEGIIPPKIKRIIESQEKGLVQKIFNRLIHSL